MNESDFLEMMNEKKKKRERDKERKRNGLEWNRILDTVKSTTLS